MQNTITLEMPDYKVPFMKVHHYKLQTLKKSVETVVGAKTGP